jgi:DNA polymerase III delta prime subunit
MSESSYITHIDKAEIIRVNPVTPTPHPTASMRYGDIKAFAAPISYINGVPDLSRKKQMKQIKEKKNVNFSDLTSNNIPCFGLNKNYLIPYEIPLIKYALTNIINQYGRLIRDMKNVAMPPTTQTIATGLNTKTAVYSDVFSILKIDAENEDGTTRQIEGTVQGLQIDGWYRVAICSSNKDDLSYIENLIDTKIEMENFYQGKSLKFTRYGVDFIPTPRTLMADAVLAEKTLKEYQLNVIDFLTDPKYYENIKKRSLLLYGPPGTGKTTSIKAFFNLLQAKSVTCISVSDDTFKAMSVEAVFSFINTYLAPALVALEDLDLIAADRNTHTSAIIGPLLSALNGIEEQEKPIVIVGTTNRPEILDEAVTRPCRFDRKIKIDYPSNEALAIMFEKKAGFKPSKNIFKQPEHDKRKLTGAHIEEICNTAELLSKQSGLPIKSCLKESIDIIRENFYLAHPSKVGFKNQDDSAMDNSGEDCPEEAEKAEVALNTTPDAGFFNTGITEEKE